MGNWGYNPALVIKKNLRFRSGIDPPCTIHVWYTYLHMLQKSTIHGKYTIGPWFYGIGNAENSLKCPKFQVTPSFSISQNQQVFVFQKKLLVVWDPKGCKNKPRRKNIFDDS